jgi:diamine N-acetyltransferase
MNYLIKSAKTAEELKLVAELACIIWREHYPGIISNEQIEYMLSRGYSIETLLSEIDEGIKFYLLYVDDAPVGFASFGPTKIESEMKLHKLYILPGYHSRGLGRALLGYIEERAQLIGAATIVLAVNKRNERAIRAYTRYGFKIRESILVDIGEGFFMDDFLMAKEIL